MSRQLGLMAEENGRRRADLPPSRIVFLLVDGRLVCPWRRRPRGELLAWQATAIEAVRAVLDAAGMVPWLAWVTAGEGVSPVPGRPTAEWVAVRSGNGQVVPAMA
jgi:hypothetical protein